MIKLNMFALPPSLCEGDDVGFRFFRQNEQFYSKILFNTFCVS